MKKYIKQAKANNTTFKSLIAKTLNQLGDENYISDVYSHGANTGFPGFTYYSDTSAFYRANKKQINELVREEAAQFDTNVIPFVLSFNCVNEDEEDNVGRCMYGRCNEDTVYVENALAWFALETVCRWIMDCKENE